MQYTFSRPTLSSVSATSLLNTVAGNLGDLELQQRPVWLRPCTTGRTSRNSTLQN
jgi:hypothetical protein